jgi:hypothetical protein
LKGGEKMFESEFYKQFGNAMWGGPIWALIGAILVLAILILLAIYIYNALAWSTILRKLKYKNPWLAWVPIAQIAPILEVGGFHWAWIFLILIPIFGWIALVVLVIISTWRIFEKRKYPGWFSLSMIIPQVGAILYLIAIGFVAWKDKGRR